MSDLSGMGMFDQSPLDDPSWQVMKVPGGHIFTLWKTLGNDIWEPATSTFVPDHVTIRQETPEDRAVKAFHWPIFRLKKGKR